MIAIIASWPGIDAINTSAIFLPISYVISVGLLVDYYEDLKRFFSDRKTNNEKITIIEEEE